MPEQIIDLVHVKVETTTASEEGELNAMQPLCGLKLIPFGGDPGVSLDGGSPWSAPAPLPVLPKK